METQLKRYQILMKNALDGIHVLDIDGNVVEANDAFCRMLGYTPQEVIHLNLADWNAQWSPEQLLERLRSLVGKSARFETRHRRKDGTLLDVEISSTGVEIDGQTYFFASSRDISERKRAEHKADVMLLRQQALMDSTLEGIHIMDIHGNIVEANDTFCGMLGYTQAEAAKLNVADWDAKWSHAELMERFRMLVRMNSALFETVHRRKDGTLIDVEVSTTGADISGQSFLFASSRDITERKKAVDELKLASMVLQNSSEGMLVTDEDNLIIAVNPAFTDITGYTLEEVKGQNPRMFRSGRHDRDFYQTMWKAIETDGFWQGEIWDRRKNGEIHAKLLTINTILNE